MCYRSYHLWFILVLLCEWFIGSSKLEMRLSDMGQLTITRTMVESEKTDSITSKNKCSGQSTIQDLDKEKQTKSRKKVYLALEDGK